MRISDWSSDVCSSDLSCKYPFTCPELPGHTLFQYVDDEGQRHRIDSGQVNGYLQDAMGEDFTAKDFRTWGATLHAAALLGGTPAPRGENKRACTTHINKVIESVAETLCNTPPIRSLCRSEEHTSELQSLMRNSYAVFCLKKK